MQRTYAVVLIVVSIAGGSIGRGVAAEAQSRAAAVKYAYVIGMGKEAVICYAESGGCRMQAVTAEPVMMEAGGRMALNVAATQGAAVAKAVAQLGDGGWEMIGPGPAYASATQEPALHFKQTSR